MLGGGGMDLNAQYIPLWQIVANILCYAATLDTTASTISCYYPPARIPASFFIHRLFHENLALDYIFILSADSIRVRYLADLGAATVSIMLWGSFDAGSDCLLLLLSFQVSPDGMRQSNRAFVRAMIIVVINDERLWTNRVLGLRANLGDSSLLCCALDLLDARLLIVLSRTIRCLLSSHWNRCWLDISFLIRIHGSVKC